MTVRLVTCRELGDDLATVEQLEADFWLLEKSATPTAILLPWFPSQAKKDKLTALRNLYTTLYRSVEMRKRAKASPINTFDVLLNQGLETKDIITMTLHMIFAGTINTGVVSCWLLLFLGMHKDWKAQVLAEVQSLLTTYATDSKTSEPIHKRLATIPVVAWEDKMPITDVVMRETIRLVTNAAAFRRNVVEDIQVAGKTIPRGGFVAYPVWDTHLNPEIYDQPLDFDPSRFGPGREEDKQSPLAHPCPGAKLAKLELKVLLALFLTAYEYDIVDGSGKLPIALPKPDYNDTQQARPVGEPCFIKFKRVVD
ncbi:hypothetical protein H0H93_009049 [Arthromyces matolae]|nr:hypothetical protein H0H93_009049 [Arthromyces matolae]